MRIPLLCLVLVLLPGCLLVSTEQRHASIELGSQAQSQLNHRGMVMSDEPTATGLLRATLPARWESEDNRARFWASASGDMQLRNDNGDAWLPDGHAGEFVTVDLGFGYTQQVGQLELSASVVSYLLPNGLEFITNSPAFSERGETKEFVLRADYDVWQGITPFVQTFLDFDEVDGFYAEIGVAKAFPLRDKLSADVRVAAGYSDDKHAAWAYGEAPVFSSGFVPLLGEVGLTYDYDENTDLRLALAGSSIIDSDQGDWFDVLGIDKDNVWVLFGATWSY